MHPRAALVCTQSSTRALRPPRLYPAGACPAVRSRLERGSMSTSAAALAAHEVSVRWLWLDRQRRVDVGHGHCRGLSEQAVWKNCGSTTSCGKRNPVISIICLRYEPRKWLCTKNKPSYVPVVTWTYSYNTNLTGFICAFSLLACSNYHSKY